MKEILKKFGVKKLGGLVLIVIIIIAFGFGGFGGGFSTNNQNNIAKINKTNVTTQDFMNYLNQSGISQQAIRENLDNNIIEELLSGLHEAYQLERHFYLISGGLVELSDNFMLKPSLLLKQTKSVAGYDFSLMAIFNKTFWIGGQIRNNFNQYTFRSFSGTGTSALLGIHLGKQFSLGYSYGFPSSIINNGLNATTHEVFLRLDLTTKSQGYLRSPRFF